MQRNKKNFRNKVQYKEINEKTEHQNNNQTILKSYQQSKYQPNLQNVKQVIPPTPQDDSVNDILTDEYTEINNYTQKSYQQFLQTQKSKDQEEKSTDIRNVNLTRDQIEKLIQLSNQYEEFNNEDPFLESTDSDSEDLRKLWLEAHYSSDEEKTDNLNDEIFSDSEDIYIKRIIKKPDNNKLVEQSVKQVSMVSKTIVDMILNRHQEKVDMINEEISRKIKIMDDIVQQQEGMQDEQDNLEEYELKIKLDKEKLKEYEIQRQNFMEQVAYIQQKFPQKYQKDKIWIEGKKLLQGLPLYTYKKDFMELFIKNQIIVVIGETGSGKSTQVPQFVLQYMMDNNLLKKGKKIACTQPRKLANQQLAQRISQELKVNLGELVGYKTGTQQKYSQKDTKLVFVMDRILIEEYAIDNQLNEYSCIIIDEAHERNLYTDLLLALVKRVAAKRPNLKIIITSATLDKEEFLSYFNCEYLEVPGRLHPVDVVYRPFDNNQESHLERHLENTKQVIYDIIDLDQKIKKNCDQKNGHILVFTTGINDINILQQQLERDLSRKNLLPDQYIVLPLHGYLDPEKQKVVFWDSYQTKIILATRIAETSLTIDGVAHVIDPGFDREMIYDKEKKITRQKKTQITKSQAKQRMGRAGRTQKGTCYRLYNKEEYEEMEDFKLPEILRNNLDSAVLKLISLQFKNLQEFNFISKPSTKDILDSYESLADLGAIQLDTEEITDDGKFIVKFQTEPQISKVIVEAIKYGCYQEVVGIVSIMSNSQLFRYDLNQTDKEDIRIKFFDESGDLLTFLNLWKSLKKLEFSGRESLRQFADENKLRYGNLRGILSLEQDLLRIANTIKKKLNVNQKYQDQDIKEKIGKCFLSGFFNNIGLYGNTEKIGYTILKQDINAKIYGTSFMRLTGYRPKWIIGLELHKGLNNQDYTKIAQEIKYEWVKEVFPESFIQQKKLAFLNKNPIYECLQCSSLPSSVLYILRNNTQRNFMNDIIDKFQEKIIFYDIDSWKEQLNVYTTGDATHIQELKQMIDEAISQVTKKLEKQTEEIFVVGSTRIQLANGAQILRILQKDEFITLYFQGFTPQTHQEDIIKFFQESVQVDNLEILQQKSRCISGQVTLAQKQNDSNELINQLNQRHQTQYNKQFQILEKKVPPLKKALSQRIFITVKWYYGRNTGRVRITFEYPEDAEKFLEEVTQRGLKVNNIELKPFKYQQSQEDVQQGKILDCISLGQVSEYTVEEQVKQALKDQYGLDEEITRIKVMRRSIFDIQSSDTIRKIIKGWFNQYKSSDNEIFNISISKKYEKYSDKFGEKKAFLQFSNYQTAKNIIQNYENKTQILGDQRIYFTENQKRATVIVQKELYLIEGFTQRLVEFVEELVEKYEDVEIQLPKLSRIYMPNNPYSNYRVLFINIVGEKPADILHVQREMISYLKGNRVYLRYQVQLQILASEENKQKLDELQNEHRVYIQISNINNRIKMWLYGDKDNTEKCIESLMQLANDYDATSEKIYLWGKNISKLLVNQCEVLNELKDEYRNCVIRFSLEKRTIQLEGEGYQVTEIKDKIESLLKLNTEKNYKECQVCLGQMNAEAYKLQFCGHKFCFGCLSILFREAIKDITNIPLKCPEDGCKKLVCLRDIQIVLGAVNTNRLFLMSYKKYLNEHSEEYFTCGNCENAFQKTQEVQDFYCDGCMTVYCQKCGVISHSPFTCEEMESSDKQDILAILGAGNNGKRCPHCRQFVTKISGCNCISCRCGHSFCYVCGEDITLIKPDPHYHFNSTTKCKLFDNGTRE